MTPTTPPPTADATVSRAEKSARPGTPPTRIAFAGSPEEAATVLRQLVDGGFEVPLVVTGPPKRRQRRGNATPTPVEAAARELGLDVSYEPNDLATVDADCGVVVAYGQLLSPEVLSRLPMLNLHFSLLPRWRGAAPVERALLAGDETTGVCLMRVEPALDTGPVYWSHEVPIGPRDTASELRSHLARAGADRLVESLAEGLGEPVPQQGEASYAAKITRADLSIDWQQPAEFIDRQVRVGGAWTTVNGTELKVLEATPLPLAAGSLGARPGLLVDDKHSPAAIGAEPAAAGAGSVVVCGGGALRLEIVQVAGRKAVAADDWLRGARLQPGTTLGT